MKNNFDIIIVGGGFSGLTSALHLSKNLPHFKIALLEKSDITKQDKKRDGRAFAISTASLEIFSQIGISSSLQEFAGVIEDIKIADNNCPFYLHFDSKKSSKEKKRFGLVIENFHIHNELRNKCLEKSLVENIEIICPNFYQDVVFEKNQVLVSLDNQRIIKGKLLLACDGKFSALRTKFNIQTFKKSYKQTALVFNISHQISHQNIALEKFLTDGPFAVLPMKSSLQSSIVWTVKNDKAQTLMEMSESDFTKQLINSLGNYLGEIKIISSQFQYDLGLIIANQFYYQRMVLIGDAAHSIHPIAGQGFNLGVDDIRLLTNLIKEYDDCGLDIGCETLLKKYSKIRKFNAYKMILATDGLNGLFSNKSMVLKIIRNAGLELVEKSSFLKNFFIKNAGGSENN